MSHGNWISWCKCGYAALPFDGGGAGGGGWGEGLWSCDGVQHRLKVDSHGRTGSPRARGWIGFLGGTSEPEVWCE